MTYIDIFNEGYTEKEKQQNYSKAYLDHELTEHEQGFNHPDSCIVTDKIADGAVTTSKIAGAAVTADKIPLNGIPLTRLAENIQRLIVNSVQLSKYTTEMHLKADDADVQSNFKNINSHIQDLTILYNELDSLVDTKANSSSVTSQIQHLESLIQELTIYADGINATLNTKADTSNLNTHINRIDTALAHKVDSGTYQTAFDNLNKSVQDLTIYAEGLLSQIEQLEDEINEPIRCTLENVPDEGFVIYAPSITAPSELLYKNCILEVVHPVVLSDSLPVFRPKVRYAKGTITPDLVSFNGIDEITHSIYKEFLFTAGSFYNIRFVFNNDSVKVIFVAGGLVDRMEVLYNSLDYDINNLSILSSEVDTDLGLRVDSVKNRLDHYSKTVTSSSFVLSDMAVGGGYALTINGKATYHANATPTAPMDYVPELFSVTVNDNVFELPELMELNGVSDTAFYDGNKCVITKRIVKRVITPNDTIFTSLVGNNRRFEILLTDLNTPTFRNMICNCYTKNSSPIGGAYIDYTINGATNTYKVYLFDSRYTNVGSFKAHIADLYNAGTPMYLILEIAEPYTIQVEGFNPIFEQGSSFVTSRDCEFTYALDLNSLKSDIDSKADSTSVTELSQRISIAENSIGNKAESSVVSSLNEDIAKLDGRVTALETTENQTYTAGNGISIVDGVISINLPRAEEATF